MVNQCVPFQENLKVIPEGEYWSNHWKQNYICYMPSLTSPLCAINDTCNETLCFTTCFCFSVFLLCCTTSQSTDTADVILGNC